MVKKKSPGPSRSKKASQRGEKNKSARKSAGKKTVAKKTVAKKTATKKTAVRKSTPKSSKKGSKRKAASAVPGAVTIRMYCQGLGDCFLLRFPPKDNSSKPVFVMIDCGVIIGTEQATEKMEQVVDDIIMTTGGKIDLLIVTHEHWDHLSAFVQVQQKFDDSVSFGAVWLAWTEQPGHPLADKLRDERKAKLKSLRAAVTGLLGGQGPALSDESTAELRAVENILDFFGPSPQIGAGFAAAGGTSTEAAMQYVGSFGPVFLSAGNVKSIPGTTARAYVLGPPQNEKLLKKDAPGKGKDEAYELRAALAAIADEMESERVRGIPLFAKRYQVSMEEAHIDPFFRLRYGFGDDALGPGGTAWQRIDEVWLDGASQLALKLDSDTNNTSLALAFELADGRTLIFPGDAQIGNWLSWQTVDFPRVGGREVTSRDLLNRAVVYKVGHHGSHNATLKSGGLEEMTSGELVALLPVNETMARKKRPPKTGWKMPFKPLYKRLRTLTGDRILRADIGASDLDQVGRDVPRDQLVKWRKFRQQVHFSGDTLLHGTQPLYVEYTV